MGRYRLRIDGTVNHDDLPVVSHLSEHHGFRALDLVRIAVTGSKRTPPLHAVIDVLGAEEVKRRLDLAIIWETILAVSRPDARPVT